MAQLTAARAGEEQYAALARHLHRWERRQRWQRTWLWLPRSLLPGLVAGLALMLWTRLRSLVPATELWLPGAVLAAVGLLLLLLHIWLRPRPPLSLARKFEQEFALGERLSTALELIEGRIHSSAELAARQVEDARARARAVDVAARLPLRSDRRAWALVLLALLAFALLLRLPVPGAPAAGQEAAQEAAIDAAAAAVERLGAELERDSELPGELRRQLQQELERTATMLGEQALSPAGAVGALSGSAGQVERQGRGVNGRVRQQLQALDGAQQAVGAALSQALQEVQDAPSSSYEDMATRLEQAAQALQESDPELAEAIRQAVQALQASQFQAAGDSAQQAGQMLARRQQQIMRDQETAQRLQAAAQQLRDEAGQIARRLQQSGGERAGAQQAPTMSELQPGSDPAQRGQLSSESFADRPGQSAAEAEALSGSGAEAGHPEGAEAGAQQGGGPPGGEQGGQGEGEQGAPGAGGQAGDAPGDAGSDEGGMGPQGAPPGKNNNPDGLGVGEFAPVYAPRRLGPGEGPQLFLETNPGDAPLVEGDFAPNPAGEALVPWNQIYRDYRDAAGRALERDYIPPGLRDVVHDYFSALEPGQ